MLSTTRGHPVEAVRRESSLGDTPVAGSPEQELSQELPRESGIGIYESLVPIKKRRALGLKCSAEDHSIAKHGA